MSSNKDRINEFIALDCLVTGWKEFSKFPFLSYSHIAIILFEIHYLQRNPETVDKFSNELLARINIQFERYYF